MDDVRNESLVTEDVPFIVPFTVTFSVYLPYVVAFIAQLTLTIWLVASVPMFCVLLFIAHPAGAVRFNVTLSLDPTRLVIVAITVKFLFCIPSSGSKTSITLTSEAHADKSSVMSRLDDTFCL